MRTINTLLSVLFLTTAASAQEPLRLSLDDATQYALKNNYNVRNAKLDVLITETQVKQTVSAAYPHVNGKADLTNFYVPQRSFIDANAFAPGSAPPGTVVAFPFSLNWGSDASITTSQILFDGSVLVALQARNTVMELSMRNAEVTEENVRYGVFKAYNAMVVAYKQFDIAKSSLVLLRSMERETEIVRKNGLAEKIDVDRLTVQVNNLATDSMRISNLLVVSSQMLKYQMGMNINTPIVLTDTAVEERTRSVAQLADEAENYDRVPEYNVLKSLLGVNLYNLKRYKMGFLPTLTGFWAYGQNYGSNHFGDLYAFDRYYANSTIGFTLNVPIFNGFLRINQVREAKLNVEKTLNNIDNMKLTIDFQSASARTTLKNSMLEAESQRRNMGLAQDVLELAQKKYKAGVGSSIEVTQAQTELLRAQNNYFTALLSVVNAAADLKKALGLLK
jgi:outer membrane protein TolC